MDVLIYVSTSREEKQWCDSQEWSSQIRRTLEEPWSEFVFSD